MPKRALPPDLSRPRPGVEPKTPEWDEWVREIEKWLGLKICGKRNSAGRPCGSPPKKGRKWCKMHGGAVVRGPSHPRWRHGRTSVYRDLLPERMRETFTRIMDDPKLLALETDIGLLETRQVELLTAMQEGLDPGAALMAITEHLKDLSVAVATANMVGIGLAAEEIAEAAQNGVQTANVWNEFMRLGEAKRKLVETEGKRLERMQTYMSASEARARDQLLIGILVQAVRQVSNPQEGRKVLSMVIEGVTRLSGGIPVSPHEELDPAMEIEVD